MENLHERLVKIAVAYAGKVLGAAAQVSATTLVESVRLPTAETARPLRSSRFELDALADRLLDLPPSPSRYRDIERALIRRALERTGNNVAAAATLLGIPRKVLIRRRERLGA